MPVDFVGIGAALGMVGLGIDRVMQYKRDKKERVKTAEYRLGENPERCKDHEIRLRSLETTYATTSANISDIKEDIREIKARLP